MMAEMGVRKPLIERIRECVATLPHRRRYIDDRQLITEMHALLQEVAEAAEMPAEPEMPEDGHAD